MEVILKEKLSFYSIRQIKGYFAKKKWGGGGGGGSNYFNVRAISFEAVSIPFALVVLHSVYSVAQQHFL